jgi:hypothetical protein
MNWEITGNAGINPTTNFLGTTDNEPLLIKTNGNLQMKITEKGEVCVGREPEPGARLSVEGGAVFTRLRVGVDGSPDGAQINGLALGYDVPGIGYPYPAETVGVAAPGGNLRLQSPNWIIFHTGNPPTDKMAITNLGEVRIGTEVQKGKLSVNGDIEVTGDIRLSNADCAEEFDISEATDVELGTVMVLDQDGALHPSHQAYDKKVAGVISGAGDYKPGLI